MMLIELVRARRRMFERKAGRAFADTEWDQLERQLVSRIEARVSEIQDFASRPISIDDRTSFRLEVMPIINQSG